MQNLKENVEQLPEPHSYTKGLLVEEAGIPQNIVMFQRQNFVMHRSMNFHNRFMLIIALAGSGTIFVGNQLRCLTAGEATLVQPFQTHYYLETSPDYHFLFITFELPYGSFSHLKSYQFNYSDYDSLLCRLVEVYLEKQNVSATSKLISMGIGLLLNDLELKFPSTEAKPSTEKEKLLLSKVIEYVYQNLRSNIKAQDVAEHAALSVSHLQRTFKLEFGISLGAFIKNAKLNDAQRLLAVTNMTVSQIVYECGYESVPSFCNAFRKHTGMTPKEFRKIHTQDK